MSLPVGVRRRRRAATAAPAHPPSPPCSLTAARPSLLPTGIIPRLRLDKKLPLDVTLKLRAARAGVFRRAAALRAGAAELRNTSQRHLNVAAKEVSVTTTTILSPRAKIGHRPLTPTESPARPGSSNGPHSAFGGSSDEGSAGVSERSTRPLVPALEHSNGGGSSLESISIVVPTSPGKASAPAAAASPAGVLRAVSSPERIAISLPGSFTRASSAKETSKQASPQADAGGGGGGAARAAAAAAGLPPPSGAAVGAAAGPRRRRTGAAPRRVRWRAR